MSSGNFRVTFKPSLEANSPLFVRNYLSLAQAQSVLNALADYTLHLHENMLMQEDSNFGDVEQFIDGEWISIEVLV
jgi:hypothetical protein